MTPPPVLAVTGARYAYAGAARAAVDGVSLTAATGEGIALLGRNGAGKTTLMRLAMGFIHPAEGDIEVVGRSTRGLGPEDMAPVAGYLFQQPESQLFERTVAAEIAFGPRQLGWSDERITDRVGRILERLDLAPARDEHPYDLPLPRRRIVALGAALAADPALLLLDEPTAGLDRRSRDLVAGIVRDHLGAGGAAVAVTHDTRFALEALGRAVVMDAGRVVADGETAPVLRASGGTLPLPPHAEVAGRLGLAAPTLRLDDVAAALAAHCSAPP